MTEQPTILLLEGICKRFGALEVLRGIDFTAKKGEVVAMIGSSGSGKSTLLRCVNLLETPTEGRLVFKGEEIAFHQTAQGQQPSNPEQLRRLRSNLSMVFQQFNLWQHMTIIENVMEVPIIVQGRGRDEVRAEALELLDKVGISDKAKNFPAQLSGGQQQRAAIARALAVCPEAMLFDEPTSALDPELEQEVMKVIRDLAEEGRTMLLVTHDMGLARDVANKVVFLNQGLIEEQGTPAEVFDNPRSTRLQQFLRASAA
ncbi:MAG: amino acid ABC transporter ATP-binding protein [Alphaproteobacteria bacterium]|nr:amino acid ABC transporter ATP-binding protein [Alphaproteobacteria bacterium]